MKNRWWMLLFPAVALSYGILALQDDLRLAVHILVLCSAIVLSALLILSFVLEKRNISLSVWIILSGALLFRLLFLFRVPELSDDIYRYLWDGLQTIHAINPYSAAPVLAGSFTDSAGLLEKINHPEFVTIYPPVAQAVFSLAAMIFHSITGLKALLVLFDIAACWFIIRLLAAMKMPVSRSILYAWHPIPVIEIAGSGHIDGVGLVLFLAALYLMFAVKEKKSRMAPEQTKSFIARRLTLFFLCGLLFGAAVLVKFMILIFFPVLYIGSEKRTAFILGFITVIVLISVPFMPELVNIITTLGAYINNWEFSNFAFRSARDYFNSGVWARLLLLILFLAAVVFVSARLFRDFNGSHENNKFIISMKACYCIALCFLIFSPTLYPWYALYLVVLFPFSAGTAGVLLSWVVLLSYQVLPEYALSGRWIESNMVSAVIWLVPVGAGLLYYSLRSADAHLIQSENDHKKELLV